jgi:hypothetical protein
MQGGGRALDAAAGWAPLAGAVRVTAAANCNGAAAATAGRGSLGTKGAVGAMGALEKHRRPSTGRKAVAIKTRLARQKLARGRSRRPRGNSSDRSFT